MPLITPEPEIARTQKINRVIQSEYAELLRQGLPQDQALSQACRNVAALLHARDIYQQEIEEVRAEGKHALWS